MKLKTYQLFNSMTPIFLVFMLVFTGLSLKAQVKLGGNWSSANPNAVLDLEASDKGLLLPRVSTATRSSTLANAPAGLVVYDTDLNRLMIKQGPDAASWAALSMSVTLPDTLKGLVGIFNSGLVGNNRSPVLTVTNGSTGIQGNRLANFTRPITTAGGKTVLLVGRDSTSKNAALINYIHSANNSDANAISLGLTGRDNILNINGYGHFNYVNPQNNYQGQADANNRYTDINFYHWNTNSSAAIGESGVNLFLGYNQDTPKAANKTKNASIAMYVNQSNSDPATWYHKVEHGLSGKSWFLRFDSNQNLILGKGDQDLRSMYLYATGTLNKGLVSMGHRNPDASAVLDLNYQGPSNDLGRGLLLPRYSTTTLNNANFYQPATGLLAFDQTLNRVVMNAGTPADRDWQPMVLGTSGSVTFSGTTVTVTNTSVKANSVIILTSQSGDGGKLFVSGRSAGSSFEITSDIPSAKTVGYLIIN